MRFAVTLLLAWFTVFGFAVGLWQAVFPASFYADFPGMGHQWVSPDGPYNEHLLRDVGLGNLIVGTVALVALLTGVVWVAHAVGLAVVVVDLPHQLYHQVHVSVLPTMTDQVLQVVSLAATSLAALSFAGAGLPARRHHRAHRTDDRPPRTRADFLLGERHGHLAASEPSAPPSCRRRAPPDLCQPAGR